MGEIRPEDKQQCVAAAARGGQVAAAVIGKQDDRFVVHRFERVESGDTRALAALAESMAHDRRNGSPCGVGIASSDLLVRLLEVPAVGRTQQRQILEHRLEAELPLAPEELRWDFVPLGAADATGTERVLLLAARAERLDGIIGPIREAGFAPDHATGEAAALAALHHFREPAAADDQQPIALVHQQGDRANVAIVRGPALCYVRELRIAAGAPALAEQLAQTLRYAAEQLALGRVGRVVVYSGEAETEALTAAMEPDGIAVRRATGDERIVDSGGRALSDDLLCEWAPVIGVGMTWHDPDRGSVSFLPRTRRASGRLEVFAARIDRPRRWVPAAAALLVVAVVSGMLTGRWRRSLMTEALADRDEVAAQADKYKDQANVMRKTKRWRIPTVAILTEIAKAAPDDVLLARVKIGRKDRVLLSGTADKPESVAKFIEALAKSEMFEGVRPDGERAEKGKPKFDVTFQVKGIKQFRGKTRRRDNAFERAR